MNIFGFRVSELVRNSIEINCNAFANKLPIHANLRQQVATKEQQLEMGIDKQKKKPNSQAPKPSEPNPLLSNCCALEA